MPTFDLSEKSALVVISDEGLEVMLPNIPECEQDQPAPRYVQAAVMCAALFDSSNTDLVEELVERMNAVRKAREAIDRAALN